MIDWATALQGLAVLIGVGFITWLVSLAIKDVSIVDSVWSLFFLAAAASYALQSTGNGPRSVWVIGLIALWAIRLSVYLSWRNWGEPEDRRYQQIRQNHQPSFGLKSLFIIFCLQAVLAWIISLPSLPAIQSGLPLGVLDWIGISVFLFGVAFESLADWQMAAFKASPSSKGQVMDQGLWRYSRHPNYFGECCVWWGFYFIAFSAGSPIWMLFSPLLMTLLLLRISGVALLEKDIHERRPAYREYQNRTSAFFPLMPKSHRPSS
jgi:steroid 5-alpha reductase family enzyme